MKKFLTLFILIAAVFEANAQEMFFDHGRIIFEKRVNMVRKFEDNKWLSDDFKDQMQKYQSSNWEYTFTAGKSLYKQAKKESGSTSMFMFGGGEPGRIFTDFDKNSRVLQKNISDVDYILNDSIPALEWKIQQDVRVIAGYECRKAVARFNDTVYAVAFYTDKILTRGGPEGFTGLPGMILGLAIPRFATTWFATKVEIVPETTLDLAIPSKGQRADTEKDYKKMVDIFMRWRDDEKKLTPEAIRRQIYSLVL